MREQSVRLLDLSDRKLAVREALAHPALMPVVALVVIQSEYRLFTVTRPRRAGAQG